MSAHERLAVDAWEAMFRAQSTLFRRFQQAPVWADRNPREYDVLYQMSLAGGSGVRQRDLMNRLMMSQPSLSRVIDRLVTDDLIDRCPDPRDGRGALLSLTAEGSALQRRIGAAHAKDVAQALTSRLSDDELVQLRSLTQKLTCVETRDAEGRQGDAA